MRCRRGLKLFYPLFATLVLAGCGEEKEIKSTQVAAKVDGSEISVHQLNTMLSNSQVSDSASAEALQAKALYKLVEQQILLNEAKKEDLDRDPDVVMAIEAAKREIISKAYLRQMVTGLASPTDQAIREYYDANPDLFAKRKLYSLQELAVEPNEQILPVLREKAKNAESLKEVADWLDSEGTKFRPNATKRAAEQIGLELLPQIAQLEDGEMTVFVGPRNYLVVRVVESQSAPVELDQAKNRIVRFLQNIKVKNAVAKEVERLKDEASIEYVGDFAQLVEKYPLDNADLSSGGEPVDELDGASENSLDVSLEHTSEAL